jgi:nicotinate-nucleotide adenylyltransferase
MGHLIMAENAMEQMSLDGVIFVPAANPPHKSHRQLAAAEDRVRMVELAIQDREGFSCSRLDVDLDEPSYTWKLLERFERLCPGTDMTFIMGEDSLRDFGSWARPERVLELARLAVIRRPGDGEARPETFPVPGLGERLSFVESPMCDISSTEIRERIGQHRTVRYLVPEVVRRYIEDHGLYRR